MLDDAGFDLEAWLANEIAMEFARAEGAAFVNGTGTNQPKGFLAAPTSAAGDTTRPFGTLQFVASGNAARLRRRARTQADRPGPCGQARPPPGREPG